MKKFVIGLSLAALSAGGVAYAQTAPDRNAAMTRAQVSANAGERFDKMDANRDGKLDQADRAAHRAQMFDRIDTDKNGSVSREEFAAHHQGMGGPEGGKRMGKHRGGHRGGMMGKMADANKDGVVTRDEFTAGMLKHFDMQDANKDGQVTAAERQAMRAQMKGMKGAHAGHDMAPPPPAN